MQCASCSQHMRSGRRRMRGDTGATLRMPSFVSIGFRILAVGDPALVVYVGALVVYP